jgi:hypothetical protein
MYDSHCGDEQMLMQKEEISFNFPGRRFGRRDCVTWMYKTYDRVTSYETNQSQSVVLYLHQHLYRTAILDPGSTASKCVSERNCMVSEWLAALTLTLLRWRIW